jgi:transposase InsO family protein
MTTPAAPAEKTLRQIAWTRAVAETKAYVDKKRDGHLYVGDRRILFTDEERTQALTELWKGLPPNTGYLRAYSLLSAKYLGIGRRFLQDFIARQPDRQKYRRVQRPSAQTVTAPKTPLASFSADFCKLPAHRDYNYALVFVDDFSGLIYITAAKSESPDTCVRGVSELIHWLNAQQKDAAAHFKQLRTDNGTGWTSAEFREFLEDDVEVRHIRSRPFHALGNARAERAVQTVRGALTSMAVERFGGANRWRQAIQPVMDMINDSYSRVRGGSPRNAAFGEGAAKARGRLAKEADSRRASHIYAKELEPGTKVRLSLRLVGTTEQKASFKQGSRKGSEAGWDTSEVYTVLRKHGPARYKLEGYDGLVDRADMLVIPG